MKRKAIVDTMMRRLETGRTERMHTKRELQKWSKAKLIREVIKLESILLKIAIRLYKSKLPRLKVIKRKALPKPKKKKEKLTKAEKKRRQKKLSALNKWRVSQGMKRIVIK